MKTIVFDLDGVVFQKSSFGAELQRCHGISTEMTAAFFKGPFVRCQLGQADLKAELDALLPKWNWPGTTDDFLEFWFSCDQRPTPGLLQLIQQLRSEGHQCVLATNQERYRAEFLQEHKQLHRVFDAIFSSCEIGSRKPEAEYFLRIERTLATSPDRLLFWDDTPANIEAARLCGWTAHLFTSLPALITTLYGEARSSERGDTISCCSDQRLPQPG